MSRTEYHVGDTVCPECGRKWTGEFKETVPEEAICRDCIDKTKFDKNQHKDIHINPKAR